MDLDGGLFGFHRNGWSPLSVASQRNGRRPKEHGGPVIKSVMITAPLIYAATTQQPRTPWLKAARPTQRIRKRKRKKNTNMRYYCPRQSAPYLHSSSCKIIISRGGPLARDAANLEPQELTCCASELLLPSDGAKAGVVQYPFPSRATIPISR